MSTKKSKKAPHAAQEGTNMTSDAGHGLAQKAIEHLKQTAISSTSSTRLRASNYWLRDPALIQKSEIVVFENETKRYTLVPSQNLLVHENNGDPGYDLFTITWNPGSNPNETTPIFKYVQDGGDDSLVPRVADPDVSQSRLFSMKSKASKSSLPCIFVALGWLREKDLALAGPMSEAGMQTTYYVVLLNLSTNPVSVWLMFDYHIEDEDGDCFRWTNRLEDYHNHVCSREFQKGRRLPKREDGFPVPTGDGTRFRNFLDQYSNLKRPLLLPRDADHAFDHPSERGTEFVPQVNGCHKRDSSASFSQGSSFDHGADNHVPINKLGKDDTGYFGLPRHDLVLLAPDINSWSSTKGFDTQQVYTCLQGTHVHLGSSLRAQTATDEQVESIEQNRINFENLGFS